MDTLTPEKRSALMAKVKGRDTGPERVVRRLVWSLGHRYRLNRADLPGKPDLVFASKKKVIFIHGCFWHRHSCRRGVSFPSTRVEFWLEKFARTKTRDASVLAELEGLGWSVLVVWECELADREALTRKLTEFFKS